MTTVCFDERNLEQIVIIGCSGHGRVVADIIKNQGRFELAGYVDDQAREGESTRGLPVLGKICDVPFLMEQKRIAGGIVAIGDNWTRGQVVKNLATLHPGFKFITAIHPSAQIGSNVTLGQGTVVMAGAVINTGSCVGESCILNTRSSLDHDCKVSSFASLAPGATIGGIVTIGEYSAICLGASVIHGIRVGAGSVVGAGAVVIRDIPENVVAMGVPARPVRNRAPQERYL